MPQAAEAPSSLPQPPATAPPTGLHSTLSPSSPSCSLPHTPGPQGQQGLPSSPTRPVPPPIPMTCLPSMMPAPGAIQVDLPTGQFAPVESLVLTQLPSGTTPWRVAHARIQFHYTCTIPPHPGPPFYSCFCACAATTMVLGNAVSWAARLRKQPPLFFAHSYYCSPVILFF